MIRNLWSVLAAVALGLLIAVLTACSSSDPQPAPPATAQQAPQAQPTQPAPVEPQSGAEQPGSAEQDVTQQRAAAPTEPQRPAPQVEPQDSQADSQQVQQAQVQAPAQEAADAPQSAPRATDFAAGLRIVSLFGDLTEIIYELGAGHLVVGRDASSIYPPEAELLPNLGFTQALSAEGVLALEPTLVIGNQTAGSSDVLEQIRDAGVEVVIIDSPSTFDAMGLKIRAVGVALGIEERAEVFAVEAEARLDAVLADVAARNPVGDARPSVLFIYVRRGGLQLVAGEGSAAATIIEAAGGTDAGTAAGVVGFVPLTPEAVVAADPEVILVMDRGLAAIGGVPGLLEIPGVALTRAGRNQRFVSMEDLYLLGFGPRLPDALHDLAVQLRAAMEE